MVFIGTKEMFIAIIMAINTSVVGMIMTIGSREKSGLIIRGVSLFIFGCSILGLIMVLIFRDQLLIRDEEHRNETRDRQRRRP
jgi:hypothetical protein